MPSKQAWTRLVHSPLPFVSPCSMLTREPDQAHLITKLSTHDTSATRIYTQLLLILPLAPIPFYLPRLFSTSTVLPSLVSIASLLATAYTLYFLPLPPTEMEPIDGKPVRGSYKTPPWEKKASEKSVRRPVPYISSQLADHLADYLVMVNRAVCGALALWEVWIGSDYSKALGVGGGFLPGVICMVIVYARTELRIIDMDSLEKLVGESQVQEQVRVQAPGPSKDKGKGKGKGKAV